MYLLQIQNRLINLITILRRIVRLLYLVEAFHKPAYNERFDEELFLLEK